MTNQKEPRFNPMKEMQNLMKYYKKLLVRPYAMGKKRSFSRVYKRQTYGGIYFNHPIMGKDTEEVRNDIFFQQSIVLLNEYDYEWLDDILKSHSPLPFVANKLGDAFESHFKIEKESVNRRTALDTLSRNENIVNAWTVGKPTPRLDTDHTLAFDTNGIKTVIEDFEKFLKSNIALYKTTREYKSKNQRQPIFDENGRRIVYDDTH